MNQTVAWAVLQPSIVNDITGSSVESSELEVPP